MINSNARQKMLAAQSCMKGFEALFLHLFDPTTDNPEQLEQACAMLEVVSSTLYDALFELEELKTGSRLIPLFEKASPRDRDTVLNVLCERVKRLRE